MLLQNVYEPQFSHVLCFQGSSREMGKQLALETGPLIQHTVEWTLKATLLFLDKKSDQEGLWQQILASAKCVARYLWKTVYSKCLPAMYTREIRGIMSVCAKHPLWNVCYGSLTIINFWMDLINVIDLAGEAGHLFWIQLMDHVISDQQDPDQDPDEKAMLVRFQKQYSTLYKFQLPEACDAVCLPGSGGQFMIRYLQFPSVKYLFGNLAFVCKRIPRSPFRCATLGLGLPGLIGCYSSMNSRGVSMSFNYFRSCGFSVLDITKMHRFGCSILMQTRYTLELASTSDQAVQILGSKTLAKERGCPYLVMIGDPRGPKFAKSVELFGSRLDFSLARVIQKIDSESVRRGCGSNALLRRNTPRPWRNMIVRTLSSTKMNKQFQRWNKRDNPLKLSRVFSSWEEEQESFTNLQNNYFLTILDDHKQRRFLVTTNNAVTPIGRCTQMTDEMNEKTCETAHAPTWRYQTWCKNIKRLLKIQTKKSSKKQGISLERMIKLTEYLSPMNPQMVDYPSNLPFRSTVMPQDMPIACSIALFNLTKRKFYLHTGPWGSPWLETQFP